MKLTQSDIADRLGLEEPRSFYYRRAIQDRASRQLGRTTWMLVKALEKAQDHQVLILCHTEYYSKMVREKIHDWARQLGINPHQIEVKCCTEHVLEGETGAIFADHAITHT